VGGGEGGRVGGGVDDDAGDMGRRDVDAEEGETGRGGGRLVGFLYV